MNILKMACLGLAVAGTSMIASADPEIVPHRGLWKNYNNSKVAENSIESYKRVKDKKFNGITPTYTEFDTRLAKIDGEYQVIIYHDNFWDRLTDYQDDTGDWGVKAFEQTLPQIHTLGIGMTKDAFDDLQLRRSKSGGLTQMTNDHPLLLKDFIDETACDFHPKIILDVQTAEIAKKVANILNSNTCPHKTMHEGNSFTHRAHMKIFASSVINDEIVQNAQNSDSSNVANALAQATIDYYGTDIKYWIQLNSSQFQGDCHSVPCDMSYGNSHFDSEGYIAGAFSSESVEGIALSMTGVYQDADDHYINSLYDTLDHLLNRIVSYNETWPSAKKKLMSIAQRPEEYIIFKSKGRNGTAGTKGKKNYCFPFIYRGDGLGIIFYSPDVFNLRNKFAMDARFDYVVADGYVDPDGKIGYDTAEDVKEMCGGSTWVATKFIINQNDSKSEQHSDYFQFTNESDDYYWLDVVKGINHLETAYE